MKLRTIVLSLALLNSFGALVYAQANYICEAGGVSLPGTDPGYGKTFATQAECAKNCMGVCEVNDGKIHIHV